MEFRKQSSNRARPVASTSRSGSIDSRPLRVVISPPPRPSTSAPLKHQPYKRPRTLRRLSRKQVIVGACILVASILIIVLIQISTTNSRSNPGFQTVSPNNKPIEQLGGWKRVSPPDSDPVFSYTDKLDDVTISVSQQPLPKGFDQDTSAKVAELAKRFNAISKLNTSSATTYIGTSSKGPQSVILAKRNLLILISSEKVIKNESWVSYIDSLE